MPSPGTTAALPVGVVIPTRNSRALLSTSMGSVNGWAALVEQIVVVDSASQDGTVELIRSELRHPRLVILSTPPGLYESWNHGIVQLKSRYTYIATVGDSISAEGLSHLVDVAERLQSDVVLSPPRFVTEAGRVDWKKRWTIHNYIELRKLAEPSVIPRLHFFLTSVMEGMSGFMGSSASNLYRTGFFQQRPFPIGYGHVGDTAWGLMNAFTARVALTPRVCAEFLIHRSAEPTSEQEEIAMDQHLLALARRTLAASHVAQADAIAKVIDDYEIISHNLRRAKSSYDRFRNGAVPWFLRPAGWKARQERNRYRAEWRALWERSLNDFAL